MTYDPVYHAEWRKKNAAKIREYQIEYRNGLKRRECPVHRVRGTCSLDYSKQCAEKPCHINGDPWRA